MATPIAGQDRTKPDEWAKFTRLLLVAASSLYVVMLAFVLLVDPYDSGRTGIVRSGGIPEQLPHSANASRARDPQFDAALFGNSHVQAIKPERLDALTGLRLVTLMMPGTFAVDQLDTLEWYLNVHPSPRAIVIGTDFYWCRDWSERNKLFPTWLYSPSFFQYVLGLASYRSLREATKRLDHLRKGKGRIKADGYWDYSGIYERLGLSDRERSRSVLAQPRPYPINAGASYPDLDRLSRLMRRVPPQTGVVLLRPPLYKTAVPPPGTEEGRSFARCLERMEAIASSRPKTTLLDLTQPSPLNEDPDNFYDAVHYRDRMAILIETALADALAGLGVAPRRANGTR